MRTRGRGQARRQGEKRFLKALGSPPFGTIRVRERIERLCASTLKPQRTGEPDRTIRPGLTDVKAASGSSGSAGSDLMSTESYSSMCVNAVDDKEKREAKSDPGTIKSGGKSGSSRQQAPRNLSGVSAFSKAATVDHEHLGDEAASSAASGLGTQGDMPFPVLDSDHKTD